MEVIDSQTMGMGLGFVALDAAHRARRGAGLEQIDAAARARAGRTSAYFYVATLEYLRRGGRIGAASALVGSALAIRPLLVLDDLAASAAARAAGPVDVAVQHLDARERAEQLAKALRRSIAEAEDVVVAEVGAVVGAHVGPGLVGVVVSPSQATPQDR